jgi:hypothetical protein
VVSLTVLLVVVTRPDRQNGQDDGFAGVGDGTLLPRALMVEPRVS